MRGNKHPAPARRHPQSWGISRCIGIGQGNTGICGFMGAKSSCGTLRAKKDAKTFKKACGKRCTIFGGGFSLAPVLPEPLNKTSPPPTKYHVPARSYAFECLLPGALWRSSMRGNKHPAPARRHPQSWWKACCIARDQGNTGIYGFMGP